MMDPAQKSQKEETVPASENEGGKKLLRDCMEEITDYEREYLDWEKKGDDINKVYAATKKARNEGRRKYNIFWSNVQTLKPALYYSAPVVNIERRYKDKDPVGLKAAEILERVTSYFVKESQFHNNAETAVEDRLLGGRGQMWVRYVPHIEQAEQENLPGGVEITNDADQDHDAEEAPSEYAEGEQPQDAQEAGAPEQAQDEDQEPVENLAYEEVSFDYVHPKDFGHNIARTWDEVYLVWRRVFLTRAECVKRFGDQIGNEVPLDFSLGEEKGNAKGQAAATAGNVGKKATIYELWNKRTKQALWLHKELPDLLDVQDDPLNLKGFFPCPKPLYATITGDSLIPTPDYMQYRDQIAELNELTARIASLTKSMKLAGVYDKSAEGVEQLLSEGLENKLVPVKSWAVYAEKGGIKGAIEFLPMEEVANVVTSLYAARDKVKQDINEITGIADIVRGNSDPDETAKAQAIKGKFATLRLSDMQKRVREFMKETVKIGAEVIAGHFQPETLAKISGVNLMAKEDQAKWKMLQALRAQAQPPQPAAQQPPPPQQPGAPAQGQTPQQPPQQGQQPGQNAGAAQQPPQSPQPSNSLYDPHAEPQGMNDPSWDDVIAVLRDDAALCFKMDIETDSTIKQDQDDERDDAIEFVKMAAGAIQQIMQANNPALSPLLCEMFLFAVRKFKGARSLEGMIEDTIEQLMKAPPAPQQPNPEQIRAQTQLQIADSRNQAQMQMKQMEIGADARNNQATIQRETLEDQTWQQNEQAKLSTQQQIAAMRETQANHRQHVDQVFKMILTKMDQHHAQRMEALKPPVIPGGNPSMTQ